MSIDDYGSARAKLQEAVAKAATVSQVAELVEWATIDNLENLQRSTVKAALNGIWPDAPSTSITDLQVVERRLGEFSATQEMADPRTLPALTETLTRHAVFGVSVLMAILQPPKPEPGRTIDAEQRIRIVLMRSVAERTEELADHAALLRGFPKP